MATPSSPQTPLDVIVERLDHWSRKGGTHAEVRSRMLIDVLDRSADSLPARDLTPLIRKLEEISTHAGTKQDLINSLIVKLRAGLV